MDFADFDLSAVSETGTWVQLEHPTVGKLYLQDDMTISGSVTDKPCRIKIKGAVAADVVKALDKVEKNRLVYDALKSRLSGVQLENATDEYQKKSREIGKELALVAVTDWENIVFKGEAIKPTPDNVLKIVGPLTAFYAQMQAALFEQRRFFGGAAKG